jgi:hypothetical protein
MCSHAGSDIVPKLGGNLTATGEGKTPSRAFGSQRSG